MPPFVAYDESTKFIVCPMKDQNGSLKPSGKFMPPVTSFIFS